MLFACVPQPHAPQCKPSYGKSHVTLPPPTHRRCCDALPAPLLGANTRRQQLLCIPHRCIADHSLPRPDKLLLTAAAAAAAATAAAAAGLAVPVGAWPQGHADCPAVFHNDLVYVAAQYQAAAVLSEAPDQCIDEAPTAPHLQTIMQQQHQQSVSSGTADETGHTHMVLSTVTALHRCSTSSCTPEDQAAYWKGGCCPLDF